MDRAFYLELAASGLRMPIGTHVVLHGHADAEAIVLDGERLGAVVVEAARRWRTPLAFPLMDLRLEKEALALACGVPPADVERFHVTQPPERPGRVDPTPRMRAVCGALRHVAAVPGLVPVGMAIGPFSLTTKLLADPISPVFLAGGGSSAADEPEVALLDAVLAAATDVVAGYIEEQMDAGARAVIVCEPAANTVYFSPLQLRASYATFDRCVMEPNRVVRARLAARGVDLIFHDCGELEDAMVERFSTLNPAILSLGSSRDLVADAARVPRTTVLYGNLPTKRFYAASLGVDEVRAMTDRLCGGMRACGHPFILGSECDILSVPGSEAAIAAKIRAMLEAPAAG